MLWFFRGRIQEAWVGRKKNKGLLKALRVAMKNWPWGQPHH